MSAETNATTRWLYLLTKHDRVSFEIVRRETPLWFRFNSEELRLSKSRSEPNWLIDMRNVRRDAATGRHRAFHRIGEEMMLSDYGRVLVKCLTSNQLKDAGFNADPNSN